MKRIFVIFVIMVLSLASCAHKGRVIPRDTLSRIYAECLIADQYLIENYNERRVADTSLFYEPILNSYGFTTDDYRNSVKYYLDDPERYEKIIEKTIHILDMKNVSLLHYKDYLDSLKAYEEKYGVKIVDAGVMNYLDTSFLRKADTTALFLLMDSTGKWMPAVDSLALKRDSLTVALADSLALADSISKEAAFFKADSVARADSIAREDSVKRSGIKLKKGPVSSYGKPPMGRRISPQQ